MGTKDFLYFFYTNKPTVGLFFLSLWLSSILFPGWAIHLAFLLQNATKENLNLRSTRKTTRWIWEFGQKLVSGVCLSGYCFPGGIEHSTTIWRYLTGSDVPGKLLVAPSTGCAQNILRWILKNWNFFFLWNPSPYATAHYCWWTLIITMSLILCHSSSDTVCDQSFQDALFVNCTTSRGAICIILPIRHILLVPLFLPKKPEIEPQPFNFDVHKYSFTLTLGRTCPYPKEIKINI